MLFTVRSRRRAASAKSSHGSGATSKPRCPGPRLLSRRGSEKSTSMPATRSTPNARPTACTLPKPASTASMPLHAETEHLDVDILRAHAEQTVAHPAPHDHRPAAGLANGPRDLDGSRIEP